MRPTWRISGAVTASNSRLLNKATYDEFSTDLAQLRRNALLLGQGTNFLIDISKFEYTAGKLPQYMDGYRIFVYSPEMIVAEKLRAICQQMPEYNRIVKRNRPGGIRARDFVDIQTVVTAQHNRREHRNKSLAYQPRVCGQKGAAFTPRRHRELSRISPTRGLSAVRDAAKPGVVLKEFDFYFDFVLGLVDSLKTLWNV